MLPSIAPSRLRALYRRHFLETPRERLFLASVAFFLAFGAIRLVTHAIRAGVGPFHDIHSGQTHIHHSVWGILLLLVVGYASLIPRREGPSRVAAILARLIAVLYGVGAALTLDEFALWLHLKDVYWERQGRASVDAAFLFGALISAGFWGGPFIGAIGRETGKLFRKHP